MNSAVNDLGHLVYLVTAQHQNRMAGFVLTWITPASLAAKQPRIILVVSKCNFTLSLIELTRKLTLNQMSQQQLPEFFTFGNYSSQHLDKFAGLDYLLNDYGVNLLKSAAVMECSVEDIFETGDRKILYCRIINTLERPAAPMTLKQALELLPSEQRQALQLKMDQDSQRDESMLN